MISRNVQGHYTFRHKDMIQDGCFLINNDALNLLHPLRFELASLYSELSDNTHYYRNIMKEAQSWSDTGQFRVMNHFWDPTDRLKFSISPAYILFVFVDQIEVYDLVRDGIIGAPEYAEIYFHYAVDFYKAYNGQGTAPTIDEDFDPQAYALGILGDWIPDETLYDKIYIDNPNWNDKDRSYFCLGVALHALQDMTCPVHAVNTFSEAKIDLGDVLPWVEAEHTTIEGELSSEYGNYDSWLNYEGDYEPKKYWIGNFNVKGWIHEAAKVGKQNYNAICDFALGTGGTQSAFDEACAEITEYSINNSAGFLFYFWQYVHNLDIDGDGLGIVEEELDYGSNCFLADSDSDGIDDWEEVNLGLDNYITNPMKADSDYDGLDDLEETTLGSDGYLTNPTLADTDGDTIGDLEEVTLGADNYLTDPTNEDTDGDGYNDGDEVDAGTDPTDSLSNLAYLWTPTAPIGFAGISNYRSKISLIWYNPTNFQPGWYYRIWRKSTYYGTYSLLTPSGVYGTTYQDYPPSIYTLYTYRIACYNLNGVYGAFSYWTGKVSSQGGGGGGGG